MRKVSHCHLAFDVDVGKERPLVVDAEGKDAMLVRRAEGSAEKGAVGGGGDGGEVETVEWGEHGELELEGVVGQDRERDAVGVSVFGKFDGEGLRQEINRFCRIQEFQGLTTSFLMR